MFAVLLTAMSQGALSYSAEDVIKTGSIVDYSVYVHRCASVGLDNSSRACGYTFSRELFTVEAFFFYPPRGSLVSFSGYAHSGSVFLEVTLGGLSSELFSSTGSREIPRGCSMSYNAWRVADPRPDIAMPMWSVSYPAAGFGELLLPLPFFPSDAVHSPYLVSGRANSRARVPSWWAAAFSGSTDGSM